MDRLTRLQPKQDRLVRGSHRAMLTVERRTFASLEQVASAALSRLQVVAISSPEGVRRMLLVAIASAAEELRRAVAEGVLHRRDEARGAALQRLAAELAEVARELRLQPFQAPPAGLGREEDEAHAASAADSYTASWRAGMTVVAVRWRGEGQLGKQLQAAAKAQDHRLERIAATEIPRAFNAAHDEGAGWVAERHKGASWLPVVVKRWDASLDRKVCRFCAAMDGRYTALGLPWPGDLRPGEPHPHCRCGQTVIVLPIAMRGELVPGHQVDDLPPRSDAA